MEILGKELKMQKTKPLHLISILMHVNFIIFSFIFPFIFSPSLFLTPLLAAFSAHGLEIQLLPPRSP